MSASDFLASTRAAGREAIGVLFADVPVADAAVLGRVLDSIADADARGSAVRPKLCALPASAARSADCGAVVYVQRGGTLAFQSQLIAREWQRARAELASP